MAKGEERVSDLGFLKEHNASSTRLDPVSLCSLLWSSSSPTIPECLSVLPLYQCCYCRFSHIWFLCMEQMCTITSGNMSHTCPFECLPLFFPLIICLLLEQFLTVVLFHYFITTVRPTNLVTPGKFEKYFKLVSMGKTSSSMLSWK